MFSFQTVLEYVILFSLICNNLAVIITLFILIFIVVEPSLPLRSIADISAVYVPLFTAFVFQVAEWLPFFKVWSWTGVAKTFPLLSLIVSETTASSLREYMIPTPSFI